MKISKKFWRGLLLIVLIVSLCGGMVVPFLEPAQAAPVMDIRAGDVIISEFRSRGVTAGDEFVELFNPTDAPIDIGGWTIRKSSGCGGTIAILETIPSGTILNPGQHYLSAGLSYVGISPDYRHTSDWGIADNGGIAVLDDSSIPVIIDRAGMCNTTAYFENAPLSPLLGTIDQSYERKLGGATSCQDTNNNSSDFQLITPSDPQNLSSPAAPCIGVANVTASTPDGTYTTGAVIDITITFGGTVSVNVANGTPTLLLETGATDRSAVYISGSGSASLSFSYTVMAGDSSSDLDYVATDSLTLNGGTITGATGDAVLILPSPGSAGSLGTNKNIMIDNGLSPSVTVNQATGQADPTSSSPINFTAVFSEGVTGFDSSDVTLGGTTGATTAVVSGGPMTYNVAVGGMTTSGTVIVSIPAGAAQDLAGNGNTASTSTDNIVTFNVVSPTGVVISEFRTAGPGGANDEYIELYNPTSTVVDISGWKINVSNDTGGTSTRATIPASTILRSGQYYLIANNTSNGYSGIVPPDLTYGQGITDAGGIALLRPDNTIVDQVGVGANSAYKEGMHVSLSPAPTQSYERKLGGASDSCQDTNDNSNDFIINTSDPKNYSSQLSRCGTLLPIPVLTTTTITADTPDPSLVNAGVSVSVRVTGGSTAPSGTVNITGANSNCTLSLNSSGTGSCTVTFTSTGTKTLTATYVGDQTHRGSSDTEPHQVSTTIRTPTPTRPPAPLPPPPLVAINEFVPRVGRDWNNDGVVNTGDEFIEIINHGTVSVNLSGYTLDDEVNVGSSPFSLPSVTLNPGQRIVFYGSQTNLLLSDGGDGVRLLKPNGQLVDAFNYTVVNHPDQSFCRLPDNGGLDDWSSDCFPTPGLRNSIRGNAAGTAGEDVPLCPIADTLPLEFFLAECDPFGHNIWNRPYWDDTGWYGEKDLPESPGRWEVFVD